MGPKAHRSSWECCWRSRWQRKNEVLVSEWTCCALSFSFTSFSEVQQASWEMLLDGEDWSTIWPTEEQIGSSHYSSRKKRHALFLLLSIIRLEEDEKFHTHSFKMLMHRRTMILHGCSTELQIVAIFSQVFVQREIFSLKYGSSFPDYLLILRGVFPWGFSHFP